MIQNSELLFGTETLSDCFAGSANPVAAACADAAPAFMAKIGAHPLSSPDPVPGTFWCDGVAAGVSMQALSVMQVEVIYHKAERRRQALQTPANAPV